MANKIGLYTKPVRAYLVLPYTNSKDCRKKGISAANPIARFYREAL
jgi:hypothetical protein